MVIGNNELLKKLRDVVENGGHIDVNTRDVLLFSAILDIYDQIEQTRKDMAKVIDETRPAIIFYRMGIWFASAIGLSIIGFFGALLTGKLEIIYK